MSHVGDIGMDVNYDVVCADNCPYALQSGLSGFYDMSQTLTFGFKRKSELKIFKNS